MALSYTKSTNSYGGRYYKITLEEDVDSYDPVNHTVNVDWKFEVLGGSVNYYSAPATQVKATSSVTGEQTTIYSHAKTMYPSSSSFPVAKGSRTGTTTFQTDSTGNLTLSIYFHKDSMIYDSTTWSAFTSTESWELDQAATIVIPTLSAVSVSSITSGGATFSASVTDNGGETPSATGIQVSATNFGTVVKSLSSLSGSVTGLSRVTTYYVRAYATNSAGTGYSAVNSFTTKAAAPTITAPTASSITSSSASLSATVSDNGGKSLSSQTIQVSASNFGTVIKTISSNSGSVTGLSRYTTYYARFVAANADASSTSSVTSFTTKAANPTVTGVTASSITATSAALSASVTDNGGKAITSQTIQVSTSNWGTVVKSISGTSGTVTGLSRFTTYYVRFTATNGDGTGTSSVSSFKTLAEKPTVSAVTASSITDSSVAFSFSVTDNGGDSSLDNWMDIFTDSACTNKVAYVNALSGSFTGLNAGRTYYLRGNSTNSAGKTYTAVKSFTTTFTNPGAPSNQSISQNTDYPVPASSFTVSWSAASAGSTAVAGYRVIIYKNSTSVATIDTESTSTSYTFSGSTYTLDVNDTVYCTVAAYCKDWNNGKHVGSSVTTSTKTIVYDRYAYLSQNGGAFVKKRMYISVNGAAFVEVGKSRTTDRLKIIK